MPQPLIFSHNPYVISKANILHPDSTITVDLSAAPSNYRQRHSGHILDQFPELLESSLRPTLTFTTAGEKSFSKTVTLRRTQPRDDAWGGADQIAESCFEVAFRIRHVEEEEQIRSSLAYSSQSLIANSDPKADFTIRTQKQIDFTHFAAAEEGELECRIRPNFSASSPAACRRLLSALVSVFKLNTNKRRLYDEKTYDLELACDRRAWANDTFHQWYLDLSAPEISWLKVIGSAEFRDIHRILRDDSPGMLHEKSLSRSISYIDSAIAKGRLQRTTLLYRAVAGTITGDREKLDLADISMQALNEDNPIRFQEPAYLFFSLHSQVALGWNRGLQKGVILEIAAPAGTPAAFLQVPGIYPERDHDEIILGRRTRLLIEKLSKHESGVTILRGRLDATEPD